MTPLAPAGAGLALVVLRRTRFAPRWVAATLILLPFIVLAAPAKAELAATILIEAPVVYALSLALRIDAVRTLIASGFINALTQPLLYLALQPFRPRRTTGGPTSCFWKRWSGSPRPCSTSAASLGSGVWNGGPARPSP